MVEPTIERAREAQKRWAATPLNARIQALLPLRRRILTRAEEIAATLADELGKPVEEALLAEVLPNADLVAYWLDHIEALLEPDEQHYDLLQFPGKVGRVYRDPCGVIGLITPWNYPVAIPLRSLVPALLSGNAVVFKPSEVTPRTGALVASLFEGLVPYGVLGLLQGDRAVGKELVRGGLDRVIFTGSVRGGREVALACAEQLIPCSLELGGKDAALVLADAELERTARGVVWGAFTNAGQNCASIERVYVESAVAEAFVARVVELTRGLRPGEDVGRLATPEQLRVVQRQVQQAVEDGAEVLAGGVAPEEGSLLYPPTVLRLKDEATPLMHDETFGPVLPILVVGSADEAVARANKSRYGLTASIWSRHLPRAQELARQLRVGVVTINNHGFTAALASAPWSGHGETGHGVTNGPHALAEMTRPRLVLTDRGPGRQELWWYPYTPALRSLALALATLQSGSLAARLRALVALLVSFPRRLREQR
ncbi:MAG: aldehyde dehydrogenase family protein [Polyangiaceae bacterium]|jgi:acyl-CoA reductase-like NAD-dependent aldehyde dehydrogenase|nr:aldehyde dehydrogenase family protein [Polyangiaceae bacterium]